MLPQVPSTGPCVLMVALQRQASVIHWFVLRDGAAALGLGQKKNRESCKRAPGVIHMFLHDKCLRSKTELRNKSQESRESRESSQVRRKKKSQAALPPLNEGSTA
jgi:hypothetical protein